ESCMALPERSQSRLRPRNGATVFPDDRSSQSQGSPADPPAQNNAAIDERTSVVSDQLPATSRSYGTIAFYSRPAQLIDTTPAAHALHRRSPRSACAPGLRHGHSKTPMNGPAPAGRPTRARRRGARGRFTIPLSLERTMRRLPRPFVWLGLVLTASCASGRGAVGDEVADSGVETASLAGEIEALWREGQTFDLFLDGVRARREAWHENYRDAVVDGALVERLGGLPGRYRLLAVSLDGCTDSVVNLPVLARLVERVPALEFRVVDAKRGRALMERYPTSDGRAATPTLVLLDDRFDVVGCWIERPAA